MKREAEHKFALSVCLSTLKRHTNAENMQTNEPRPPLFNTHKRVIVM